MSNDNSANGYIGINNRANKISDLYIGMNKIPIYEERSFTLNDSNINDIFDVKYNDDLFMFTFNDGEFYCNLYNYSSANPVFMELTSKVNISQLSFNYSGSKSSSLFIVKINNEIVVNKKRSGTYSGSLNAGDIITIISVGAGVYTINNIHGTGNIKIGTENTNSTARKVKSAYIGVNNKAKLWYSDNYKPKNLGIWTKRSTTDINTFFNTYKHSNNYNGLKLGDYLTIADGTYDAEWEIAGFDCEHNQLAADGTIYDNGYGICMIPRRFNVSNTPALCKWAETSDYSAISSGYYGSYIHNTILNNMASALKTVLGTHMVNRNVLLSSSVDSSGYYTTGYTWTTAYCTLMSHYQITNKYTNLSSALDQYSRDEANYRLPLFNYENRGGVSDGYWLRYTGQRNSAPYEALICWYSGNTSMQNLTTLYHARPLIYLR